MKPDRVHPADRERDYQKRVERLEKTLGTLIVWITQSAGSPLSEQNAADLLAMLNPLPPPPERQRRSR